MTQHPAAARDPRNLVKSRRPTTRRWTAWDERLLRVLTRQTLWALPAVWRYGLALVVVLVATLARRVLLPGMGTTIPYNITLLAAIATTVVLGLGPGVLTVLLCDVAVEVFIVRSPPAMLDGPRLSRLGVSAAIGVFVTCLLHAIRIVAVRSRQMEAALELASRKYSLMFDTTSDGVWIHDLHGQILEVNDAYCQMSGYGRDELVGMPISTLEANESADEIARHIRKVIARGGHDRFESRHRRRDGTIFDVDITALYIDVEGGRIAIFVRDITARRQADEAVRQSLARRQMVEAVDAERRRLYDVLETVPTMVCLLTPDYQVPFANRAFREKFGAAQGRPCFDYCFGRSAPCEFCESFKVLETGQPHRWRVTGPDGSVIEAHDFPFTDVNGAPMILEMDVDITEQVRIAAELAAHRQNLEVIVNERTARLGVVNAELQQEIAERRRTEGALRETHDYLQNLIDYANAPIIVWNPAFQITRFNHAFERLTGRSAGDVIGRELEMLFPRESRDGSMAHIRRTATGERWETLEIPIEHVDGRVRTVLWNSATLFDTDGATPVATIAQGQDITDRKQLEEDLRAAAERLGAANRLKDEFLSTLSHELRTPLNAILGWTQMLLRERLAPEQARHALEVIGRNAEAQVKLVEDVLDVSRILSGKMRLAMRRVDLIESVNAALDSIRPTAEAKGIEIFANMPASMPIVGDFDRLQQLCWNLLSNSVKFTPGGGRVDVCVRRTDSQVDVSVRDTGIGIAPDFLPHLFERFRQADSSITRTHGGLGLGLALVRQLVELHGGHVSAESAGVGEGATFVVTLPVSAVVEPANDPDTAPLQEQPPDSEARALALGGIRVLVVDDEPDARDLLNHALRSYGAEVHVAESARAGLDALQQWRPDVVLADIGMPSEDGYELIRKIRALPPERGGLTPAAALTAYGGADNRERALSAGYQQHIAKPVIPQELARIVSHLAGGARTH